MSTPTLHTECTCCEHAAKEIARLKAELDTARETISFLYPYAAAEFEETPTGPAWERARAFLSKHQRAE